MPAERDPIALLLAGQYPDPDTGQLIAAESRAVVIEDSLAGSELELIAALGLGRRVAVVSDPHTHRALGDRVERALRAKYDVQSIILEIGVHADEHNVKRLLATLSVGTDLVVAVGSGTINDLCKMAAFKRGCAQVVFATAPSMNGYTSLSASITTGGVKSSFRTRTPMGAYFDLAVIAAAPTRLIRAGLGDSVCRPTAQADWLLAHLLLDRPYREAPFALLADDERELLAYSQALTSGDLAAMRRLVRTLVLSGFGMTICNGSYPASQGEHLLSHYVDMMGKPTISTFHGEQIGVCTIAMAGLQQWVLARDTPPVVKPTSVTREQLIARYGAAAGETCWHELEQKRLDAAGAEALNARLRSQWDAIRSRISSISVPAAAIQQVLTGIGAPIHPGQLGWSPDLMNAALAHAREIRNRYTFLDLVADS